MAQKFREIPVLGNFFSARDGFGKFVHKTIHLAEYRALLGWLRRARERRGLTMAAAGAKVDKPPSWVAKTEGGERRLDVAEYVCYCRALEVSPARGLAVLKNARF